MIAELQESDGLRLVSLEAQAQSGANERQLHAALTDTDACVMGCFQENTLAGYALVARLPFDAELQAIGVDPAHRHLGLGYALMQAVMLKAAEWQSECLLLEVRVSNKAAISLYQRFDFKVDGQRKGYYPAVQGAAGREDALLMSRTFS